MKEVLQFLKARTPQAWLDLATDHIDILLIDHAHCEKKAASTALQLMFRYVDRPELLQKMAQLAREELLHFEQVLDLMQQKNITYTHMTAAQYAQRMRSHCRTQEPGRLVDTLIIGAIIEARSCERFLSLADHFEAQALHPDLVKYYRYLLKSESRHFLDYLELAKSYAKECIQTRVDFFLAQDVASIHSDDEFRFHSGTCVLAGDSTIQNSTVAQEVTA